MLVTLTVLGAGVWTWVVFLMLGIRARRRAWLLWSAVYAALTVALVILETLPDSGGTAADIAVIPFILAWFGGIVHVAVISKDATRRIQRLNAPSLVAARERIERRAEGRRLAAQDPLLARELGVGCPGVPRRSMASTVEIAACGRCRPLPVSGVAKPVAPCGC